MDLIALGRFVLQREDDLNLAALLRSPFCGLGEEDLFSLAHGRSGDLWSRLVARQGRLRGRARLFVRHAGARRLCPAL
jgi:ATP-dependent helicase/nuclease subunit A